ncbi:YodC family protein [Flavobacterium gyeonganense]|uniref:YodC family protein n=1 Tax=Flavobacterium gyeonganense TaxID=1310418 RepID=A0ABV5H777_9FLAO|nr:DUF2158 domain-containing protein [Flavobacterium gyeonganense]
MVEFKPGDTVRLKSGGPLMTIDYIEPENGLIACEWFDKKALKSSHFKATSIEHDNDDIDITFL